MTPTQFLELSISLSLQAAVAVVITHVLTVSVDARAQCRLWAACHSLLLLLLIAEVVFPHPRWFQPWSQLPALAVLDLATIEGLVGCGLFVIWVCGAVLSLLLFVYRTVEAGRFVKSCTPIDSADRLFAELTDEGRERSAQTRNVRLLISDRLCSPVCWQFHRPYIIFPKHLLVLDRRELLLIVRHELEHLWLGHPLQLFVQRLVEIAFWFHPAIWWASRRSTATREFACDDAAIDSSSDVAAYLRTLLAIIERGTDYWQDRREPLAFGREKSLVAKRVDRLVQTAHGKSVPAPRRLTGAAAAMILMATFGLLFFVWLPIDVLASPRAQWSPWPKWTAHLLHDCGIVLRDYEAYARRTQLHEIREHALRPRSSPEFRSEQK
jgi:beta-lactamase regulating signal transducer with metallopeptidase domain